MKFKNVCFVTSALEPEQLPTDNLPEVVVMGPSNVGKSSLINHLLQLKKLAKVSSTPGKTQRMNYFLIDKSFYLVDSPGYGYAKIAQRLQKDWAVWIEAYLKRAPLRLIVFLTDARRKFSKKDRAFLEWAQHHKISLLPVMTKGDKLSKRERRDRNHSLLYSTKEGKCREILIHKINDCLWG